ncbi:NAD-dependent epimerase/dehydratase family protein [Erythrobacter insulae]|uniref:Divinyl chlorophyllide a 8-vinyl-reductase, chloroplastic n=1 Tax=Erythrobacter insulae TaxID=2584124 RepID=A0A547PCD6_9SPHN|nr:NAD(P)H-binding protein [Erythrobacter insulae]TRD11809.1 NAD-dependent epimerase/dehydratase family protein [Erythrobacter insulae]
MDGAQQQTRVLLAGASGTIGRAVMRALEESGHDVTAITRRDFAAKDGLAAACAAAKPATVISCIASRSGSPKDAEAVDFLGNLNLLKAAKAAGAQHFILLSAICVQKPRLAFQHAKIAFERALKASPIDHTIVRPTAFFKSLSGQVDRVAKGKPFMIFGDGNLTRCKPISDRDLARFIADCVTDPERRNTVLPIGGTGPAISLREQGELIFQIAGTEPRFKSISPRLFTGASRILSIGAPVSGWFAEKAEYARIAHYYATESMLLIDPETGEYSAEKTPEFGSDTLADHYRDMLKDRS